MCALAAAPAGAAAQDSVTATAPPGTLNSVRMPGNPIKSQQRLSQGGNAGAGQQRPIDGITKGTRVVLKDQRTGMVKWVGLPDTRYVTKEPLLGVHLDDPVGKHDGMLNGKRYFTTPPNHAVFVKKRDVLMVIAPKSMTPHHYARVNPERDTRLKGTKNADAAPTSIMDKLAQKMAQDASGEPATIAASKAEAEMRARREKLRQKLNVAQVCAAAPAPHALAHTITHKPARARGQTSSRLCSPPPGALIPCAWLLLLVFPRSLWGSS